jgi:hypothetical protein
MAQKTHAVDTSAPLKSIRRFDVFAEVSRLEALEKGRPEDEAKGYGIWLAKVVAARRFGPKVDRDGAPSGKASERTPGTPAEEGFKAVGGEMQTDETFDGEIIHRMGEHFYDDVFAPAIREAIKKGQRYEEIRDSIRADWKARR